MRSACCHAGKLDSEWWISANQFLHEIDQADYLDTLLAQCREYRQRPEVRERKRKYQRVYQQRPDVRDRQRDRQRQHYQRRPEVRQRQRERALTYRLRREVSDRERDSQR